MGCARSAPITPGEAPTPHETLAEVHSLATSPAQKSPKGSGDAPATLSAASSAAATAADARSEASTGIDRVTNAKKTVEFAADKTTVGAILVQLPSDLSELHAGNATAMAPDFAPHDLTAVQAAQLQAMVGGSGSPHAWIEVYRGSRDDFTAASFHGCCDNKSRLLVLVRDAEAGWLFGGFTALGFLKANAGLYYTDPAAFLFSLTNPAGRPERLASKGVGSEVGYCSSCVALLGNRDLAIFDGCSSNKNSYTKPGSNYASPSVAGGSHQMSQGQVHFTAAELVAWTVPE